MSFDAFVAYEAGRLLKQCGAVINDDHFVYASGLHGSAYVNKNAVLDDRERLRALCDLMTLSFTGVPYDAVVGPESGGIKIADGVAVSTNGDRSGPGSAVLSYHAIKAYGGFDLRPDAWLVFNRPRAQSLRVLVVEDVLTTGGSCRKVVELVRRAGAEVVGVGAFVNRGSVTAEALGNVPQLVSLVDLPLRSWDEAACPMCRAGVPVRTDLGKGKAFVERGKKEAP